MRPTISTLPTILPDSRLIIRPARPVRTARGAWSGRPGAPASCTTGAMVYGNPSFAHHSSTVHQPRVDRSSTGSRPLALTKKISWPFAPADGSLAGMETQQPTINSILRKIREAEQTSLYKWMATNHAKMVAAAARGRVACWTDLLRDFEALGLLDGHGKTPSVQSARKTWARVKADAEKVRQEAKRVGRSASSSRHRADWQPPLSPSPRGEAVRQPIPPRPKAAASPTADTQPGSAHVEAQLAALDRQFAYIDRHIVQQPDEE